jgi:hypothetical protein
MKLSVIAATVAFAWLAFKWLNIDVDDTILAVRAPVQTVTIARYGLRETSLIEFRGPYDMDISEEGVGRSSDVERHCYFEACRFACKSHKRANLQTAPFFLSDRARTTVGSASCGCRARVCAPDRSLLFTLSACSAHGSRRSHDARRACTHR